MHLPGSGAAVPSQAVDSPDWRARVRPPNAPSPGKVTRLAVVWIEDLCGLGDTPRGQVSPSMPLDRTSNQLVHIDRALGKLKRVMHEDDGGD
jgi:hypothetical protein